MGRFRTGDRVTLVAFNGTAGPQAPALPENNYWVLIGRAGEIFSTEPDDGIDANRVLVRFDDDVLRLGLACHNPVPNTLWIAAYDLKLRARKHKV